MILPTMKVVIKDALYIQGAALQWIDFKREQVAGFDEYLCRDK